MMNHWNCLSASRKLRHLIFSLQLLIILLIWQLDCPPLRVTALRHDGGGDGGKINLGEIEERVLISNQINFHNNSHSVHRRSLKKFRGKSRFNGGGGVDNAAIHMTAPELIRSRGYNVEIHRIFTTDGYILEAHRIPAPGKPAVFAFHGMFQSSRDFLMHSDHKALPYKLADAGFDVWLGNARGNVYSRRHSFLKINSGDYWNYSVDEIILYDIPASIDYVLAVTNQPQLNWVGYSLGTAVIFGLMSARPEYNDKVNLFVSLGTTAYVGHTKSPVLRILAPFANLQDSIVTTVNHGEYLPTFLFPIMRALFPVLCYPEASINVVGLCSSFLFIIAGFNPAQSNPSILPIMLGGTPSSISVKMLSQWYQWIDKGRFSYFDFGPRGNLARYHTTTPPSYDLSRVTCKTANFYAQNDWLSPPQDVQRVVSELPNVVANIKVEMESFNHLDFLYGKNADYYVYDKIINLLKAYTS